MSCVAELHIFKNDKSILVRGIKRGDALLVNEKENDDVFFRLEDLIGLKKGANYTDLIIMYYDDAQQDPVPLLHEGKEMRLLLLEWLKCVDNQTDPEFDCFSFANALHGGKFLRPVDNSYMLHGPGTGGAEERTDNLKPLACDLVFFYDNKAHKIKHFAICLTDDLYLFKYGMGGHIFATNTKVLYDLYQCDLHAPVAKICHNCVCNMVTSNNNVLIIECM